MGCVANQELQPHKKIIVYLPQKTRGSSSEQKESFKDELFIPIQNKIPNLPVIQQKSEISQLNLSDRPQWEEYPPRRIKAEDIVIRGVIPNQSAVNILYSSDPFDKVVQKTPNVVPVDKSKPFSLIIQEEPQSSISASVSGNIQYPAYQPLSKIVQIGKQKGVPSRIEQQDEETSIKIKNVTSVIEDYGAFNDEKTIDIIGFDLKFRKVQINPHFPSNHK